MNLKLFTWCELDFHSTGDEAITKLSEPDARAADKEGGWELKEHLPNGVLVLSTDRHFALEVWAADRAEAHAKFLEFPYYREWQE